MIPWAYFQADATAICQVTLVITAILSFALLSLLCHPFNPPPHTHMVHYTKGPVFSSVMNLNGEETEDVSALSMATHTCCCSGTYFVLYMGPKSAIMDTVHTECMYACMSGCMHSCCNVGD